MNKTEIIFKIIEVSIAFIGLVLVIFGWIIPHRNSMKAEKARMQNDKELERIRWKKELIDKQIQVCFVPLLYS